MRWASSTCGTPRVCELEQHHPLVQDAVVLDVVEEGRRHRVEGVRQEHTRPGDPQRWVVDQPVEIASQLDAILARLPGKDRAAASPGREHREGAGTDHQRQPAPAHDLGQVGGEECELDGRGTRPLRRSIIQSGFRHTTRNEHEGQQRVGRKRPGDGEPVGRRELGGDSRNTRTSAMHVGRQTPVDERQVNLPLGLASEVCSTERRGGNRRAGSPGWSSRRRRK